MRKLALAPKAQRLGGTQAHTKGGAPGKLEAASLRFVPLDALLLRERLLGLDGNRGQRARPGDEAGMRAGGNAIQSLLPEGISYPYVRQRQRRSAMAGRTDQRTAAGGSGASRPVPVDAR